MLPDDDPGWPLSWRMVLALLVPGLLGHAVRRRALGGKGDGLVLMRQAFLTFCASLVMFGVVLALIYTAPGTNETTAPGLAIGLLVAGAAACFLGPLIERPLVCTDNRALAMSYRTRFFLRVAFSEAPALFGFVAFFITYEWWSYPVGVAIAAFGFRRAAPTAAHLAQDQQVLNGQGCGRSLVRAVRGTAPPEAA